jgi:cell wall-associated NlpC family hydrolase
MQYVGLPFKDGGRARDGLDCWGLVWLILREQYGVDLPSYAGAYRSVAERAEVTALVAGSVLDQGWQPTAAPYRAGDGIILRIENHPWHVGLLLNDTDFIHVPLDGLSWIESITDWRWVRRIVGVYRHPRLAA